MYGPAIDEWQLRVAVPWPDTEAEEMLAQISPAGNGESSSVTVPWNPLTDVTVMVDAAVAVPSALTDDGVLAAIVKSVNANVTVVWWVSEPLVPVIVAV